MSATAVQDGIVLDNNNNVGLGTDTPQAGLTVLSGNVGLGTWTAAGGRLIVVKGGGNVGIGTIWPGQALDVSGTARVTGFTPHRERSGQRHYFSI